MVPPQSMLRERNQPIHGPGGGGANQSMAQEGEPNQSMAQERTSPKPDPESMHMEGEFCLAMTLESIHAHGLRICNLDQRLSLYPIAKLSELMPYCLLQREG